MAIAFRSSTNVGSAVRTNTTVTVPAGAVTGSDIILVAISIGNPASTTITTPSGWAQISTVQYSDATPFFVNVYLFVRVHDGAASWVFPHASATTDAGAEAWSGVDNANPSDATPQTQTGTATNATIPSIDIVTAGAQRIGVRGSWDGNAITPPASWNERKDTPILWVGDIAAAGTGATGTTTISAGNAAINPWGIIHAALRPDGPPPPPAEEAANSDAMNLMGKAYL